MATRTSYNAIMSQIQKLQKQAGAVRNDEVKSVVARIQKQMQQYGLSASDLGGTTAKAPRKDAASASKSTKAQVVEDTSARKNKAHTRRKAEIKFRDPVSGATWSGRGRTPKWITGTKGKTKEHFAIA